MTYSGEKGTAPGIGVDLMFRHVVHTVDTMKPDG